MSEDLIRRSDAIEAIELVDWYHQNRNKDMVSGANSSEHQAWYKAEDIYKALEAVPATKPKRGKWIFDDPLKADFECSECLERSNICTPFCPNCGVNMRGLDNE